jgi:hypothetical protein
MRAYAVTLGRSFVAGFACWFPMLICDLTVGKSWPSPRIWFVTISMPVVALAGAVLSAVWAANYRVRRWVFVGVLMGLWVTGPIAMCLSERLEGVLCTGNKWDLGLLLVLLFPISTPYMSIYHGTFFGLLGATVVLILYGVFYLVITIMRRVAPPTPPPSHLEPPTDL